MVNYSRNKGHRDLSLLSLSRLLMVHAVIEATFARRIDGNDEFEALTASLTIDRFSHSVVKCVRQRFTHSCQNRLVVASLLSKCRVKP